MFANVSSYLGDLPWWTWASAVVVLICIGDRNEKAGSFIVVSFGLSLIAIGMYGIWSSGIPQAAAVSFLNHVL